MRRHRVRHDQRRHQVRALFMGQVAQAGQQMQLGTRHLAMHLPRLACRHGEIAFTDDQHQAGPQGRQRGRQFAKVPVGHHRQRSRHMTGVGDQLCIGSATLSVDA